METSVIGQLTELVAGENMMLTQAFQGTGGSKPFIRVICKKHLLAPNESQEDWKEVTKEWADSYYPYPDNYV